MQKTTKADRLFVRLPESLREQIQREAGLRGESESVVVREALREYFEHRGGGPLHLNDQPATRRK